MHAKKDIQTIHSHANGDNKAIVQNSAIIANTKSINVNN
jgi:hypothetical protein